MSVSAKFPEYATLVVNEVEVSNSNPLPVALAGGSVTISGPVDVTPASPTANDYLPVRLTDGVGFITGGGGTEYDEDTPHVSGAKGNLPLAVRRDADTSLVDADGDYAPVQVNAAGALKVAVPAGVVVSGTVAVSSVGGTVAVTQSGSWSVSVSGVVDVTPASPAANDYLPVRLTDGAGFITAGASGIVSTVNSSTATLTSGSTFTGTSEDATNYAAITLNVIASHDSAALGLSVEWSSDGTNWDGTPDKVTVKASVWRSITLRTKAKFFRVKYTNGGTNQSSFRLQTVLHPSATREEMFARTFEVVLPISTSPAYSTGDNIGGLLTFTEAVPPGRLSGTIHAIILTDKDKESSRVDVVFFGANPASSTFTDNTAQAIDDADLPKFIGHKRVETADYVEFSASSAATVSAIGLPFTLDGGTTLYAAVIIRAGKTFTSTTDLTLKVVVLPGES